MIANDVKIPLMVVVGPTAAGKTGAIVAAAKRMPVEVISADSRQVYKGMEIGTGAPSREELDQIPHHFVSCLAPDLRLSAGEFARQANLEITQIIERGYLPVVVGGSGLYIRALVNGLSAIPTTPPELREQIQAEVKLRGTEAMMTELAKVDPDYAMKISKNNEKRLIRALEVWRMTGKSLTTWHQEQERDSRFEPHVFGLTRSRAELWQYIEKRIVAMIEAGWIEEVRSLSETYGGFDKLPVNVAEGLGYREMIKLIQGEQTLEDTVQNTTISTRQFAKRQMTWFRADSRIEWLEASGDEALSIWETRLKKEINTLKHHYINQLWSSNATRR